MKYSPERIAEINAKRLQTRAANKIIEQKAEAERRERFEMEKDYLGREVMRLRTLVKELNDQSPLLDVCRQMTGRTLHTEAEIVAVSEPYVRLCGIYFLVANDRVVYVGQSVNIAGRIGTHASTKKFDRVAFVPCEEEHMNILESLYIHILRPPLNGNSNSKGLKTAPMTMQEMLRYIGPAYDLARGIVKAQQNVVA
jgi:hypothetical protein